ncbi:MAG: tetraacyldisaccharide 4'-kinase [Gemmatimonadota bacterium]|jgi:tetraacyldisaccharide 4'-kinase
MRASFHAWIRRWWAGRAGTSGAALSVLTAPLEWLYGVAVRRRNRSFDRRGATAVEGLRVVSVGNLAVGGTGKTPLAAWTARLLADDALRPCLVARGYGEDELLLHRRWNPDVPVEADADRVAAAGRARASGAEVAVLDDGFQHRRLARDVDLVLLAAEDRFPGRLLPRGPYREPPHALTRAHAVVVTRRSASASEAAALAARVRDDYPRVVVARVALVPGGWRDLEGREAEGPSGPTLCAAAVARPEAFADHVRAVTGKPVELVSFPDHHGYRERDARALRARAGSRTLVVTEKDAVKLEGWADLLAPTRVLVQELRWEEGEEELKTLITSVPTRGKS